MDWCLDARLAPARRADPALDFCLWPYDPPRLPGRDSWQGAALLYHSFATAGLSHRMLEICDALIAANGPFNTVWGLKHAGGRLSWEFYFYDYTRLERRFDTRALARALEGLVTITAPLSGDDRPYFMFSIEIGADQLAGAPVDQLDLYLGNPGSTVSSGICYGLSPRGWEMRNFYFFFNALTEAPQIRQKLAETAHAGQPLPDLSPWLWRGITPQTLVVANKRAADGVYFSRIPADQTLTCLERLGYPEAITGFFRSNRARFDHLLFDIGYDWQAGPQGITWTKGSVYGLL
ncbi:hypothetical protein KM176_10800 [Pseudooceanicola sp. CBS1P-1]|uniref:Uncharacterized protein n=1 Tax=Pseudooceanicola albus TaxID=2692189 RepID=A0A6L7G7B1_9RHOB|nr:MULTISPECIES: hypothetical protein [Pseudooceanicola]MBT9384347.1 hypothetical protein [Pseudooceanicola endophyticus]MXN19915.1 hypothetical protein [Pseudooceanicola albus]